MNPEYLAAWDKWHVDNNCDHVHCPLLCEHPQPILTSDNRMLCQACWINDGLVTECLPCVVGVCDD